jgi:hypothetical protein
MTRPEPSPRFSGTAVIEGSSAPRRSAAACASSTSEVTFPLLGNRSSPSDRTNGAAYSRRVASGATARAVHRSDASRLPRSRATSSARPLITSTDRSPSDAERSRRNRAFFPTDSISVSVQAGNRIFNGMPGKPAPAPTSTTRTGEPSIAQLGRASTSVRESRKSVDMMAAGDRMAVRFVWRLVS